MAADAGDPQDRLAGSGVDLRPSLDQRGQLGVRNKRRGKRFWLGLRIGLHGSAIAAVVGGVAVFKTGAFSRSATPPVPRAIVTAGPDDVNASRRLLTTERTRRGAARSF
ncbi:MAG: hypothetical protein ACYS0G_05180 [Planctomycetota bacterium]